MTISLAGKAALVTGAARGIGFAIARLLAEASASVLLVDVDEAALREAKASLAGHRVETLVTDLTSAGAADVVVARMLADFQSIDIIVNNAGYTWDSVIQKTSDQQFQAMLDIHVVAPFRILRAASNWIRETAKQEREAGRVEMRKVVNITSISGLDGNPGQGGYSAGKAAVVGFTKTMAKEWGRYNVNVNAVAFGLIDTRLTQPMHEAASAIEIGEKHLRVGMRTEARDEASRQIPLGRIGTPEDAARAVFFFCSPLSDYVTAETLVCGGGLRF